MKWFFLWQSLESYMELLCVVQVHINKTLVKFSF